MWYNMSHDHTRHYVQYLRKLLPYINLNVIWEHYHHTSNVVQVDRLEDELVSEQEKFKAITEELEQTFAEMSGY